MNRKFLIPFLTVNLLFFSTAFSQQNVQLRFNMGETALKDTQPVVAKVIYQFRYIPDTTKKDSSVTELLELDLGKTASSFYSFSKHLKDSAVQKAVKEQMKQYIGADGKFNAGGKQVHIDLSGVGKDYASITQDRFYTTAGKEDTVLNIQNIFGSAFLIKDSASKINWKILDSTKTIQGNLCQKAIGKSHGRTYTAWFCSDIPCSFGPRKLHGLPGLILEAYDEKQEINYSLQNIQTNIANEKIGLPKEGIYATAQEFNKAKAASEKNPEAFMNNHNSNPNAKVFKVVSGGPAPGAKVEGLKITKPNNLIDLQ